MATRMWPICFWIEVQIPMWHSKMDSTEMWSNFSWTEGLTQASKINTDALHYMTQQSVAKKIWSNFFWKKGLSRTWQTKLETLH